MIEIFEGTDLRLAVVRALRSKAFQASKRNVEHLSAWLGDHYDKDCQHIMMRDKSGEPIAAVRMVHRGRWPLEERFWGSLDKRHGAEFGRLAVAQRYTANQRTLYELMMNASRHCLELGRTRMFGLTIAPFWRTLDRLGIPLTVISEPIFAYGEEQNVVLFNAHQLVAYYEGLISAAGKNMPLTRDTGHDHP